MYTVDLSPYSNKYILFAGEDIRKYFRGINSYSIAGARILGMSYAEYLRYARDNYNATIQGKQGYPILTFSSQSDAKHFACILNKYWRNGTKIL